MTGMGRKRGGLCSRAGKLTLRLFLVADIAIIASNVWSRPKRA